jgi:hypothetical protein
MRKLILPLFVLFWVLLGTTVQPFRSHPWLTILCAPASLLVIVLSAGFLIWLKRRTPKST